MEVSAISQYREEQCYPRRLYVDGPSNLENKNINHYCRIGELPTVRDTVGSEVWEQLMQSPLGIIAKLAESKVVWFGKTVHYMLCRQLRVKKNEIWSIVHDQPIRFELNEYHDTTGLNIDPLPTEGFEHEKCEGFWRDELNVEPGMGPKWIHLMSALKVCRRWSAEKRKWLGLLFLQATGVHALHQNSRIPFECAKRVFDDQAMMSYPWGRIGFDVLVEYIQTMSLVGKTYHVKGCIFVLLASGVSICHLLRRALWGSGKLER